MFKFTRRQAASLLAIAGLAYTPSLSAYAQDSTKPLIGVVELFTSQGCSSCPPADAALEQFIERDDVLALAFHVPYWDYLGWKDTLASPDHETRQRGYRKTFGARTIYTPQAVINGREHVVGSRPAVISAKLGAHAGAGTGLTVPIDLERVGDRIKVAVDRQAIETDQDVKLVLVYYKDETTVQIDRGENTGREITYRNTVTDTQVLGMWDGQSMELEIPYSEINAQKANGCAVLLQAVSKNGSPGAILGAAILPRRNS